MKYFIYIIYYIMFELFAIIFVIIFSIFIGKDYIYLNNIAVKDNLNNNAVKDNIDCNKVMNRKKNRIDISNIASNLPPIIETKRDGTPLKSILRNKSTPILSNKSVSFNDSRATKIGNKVRIEQTFNKNTMSNEEKLENRKK